MQDQVLYRHIADLSVLLRGDEQPHLGAAKAVDRLHRIADGEERPAVVHRPSRRQPADEILLRIGRVLELVDEQMPDPVVEPQQQVGGLVRIPQRLECCECRLREIDRARGPEHERELRGDPRQDVEESVDDGPRVVVVPWRR
jgi:hypothetical protein